MKDTIIYAGDFETTYGSKHTEVWSSAFCKMHEHDNVIVHHSIEESYYWLDSLEEDTDIYYHNLAFDGSFWLSFFIRNQLKDVTPIKTKVKSIKPNEYMYLISGEGAWYWLCFRNSQGAMITFKDSFKIAPLPLRTLGKAFETEHQKLEMDYKGDRYANCPITEEEMAYIKNDVLVLIEVLEVFYELGYLEKLTIASLSIHLQKEMTRPTEKFTKKQVWNNRFPNLTKIKFPCADFENYDQFIRRSYHGGWCYVKDDKAETIWNEGCTYDVNSLYPSMMYDTEKRYPVGKPKFFNENGKLPYCIKKHPTEYYYFIKWYGRFRLKPNYLPLIQIKKNIHYKATDYLKTNEYYDPKTKEIIDEPVELYFSQTDYELFLKHYDVRGTICYGCYFHTDHDIWKDFLDHFGEQKRTSKGAKRTLAKLIMNSSYGKFATSPDKTIKIYSLNENGALTGEFKEKTGNTLYVAIACAITSYAKAFTITHAQMNYKYFVYADTDSIHCCCSPDKIVGIKEHPTDFSCWKLESQWDKGFFLRQKTYAEHITHDGREPIDQPKWDIKACGMPERCKTLFRHSIGDTSAPDLPDLTKEELEFMTTKRSISDFKVGLVVPGKLVKKFVDGGTILQETNFTITKSGRLY